MALIVRYILGFKLKKLLLIVLLLAQPIYADSNGISKLIIPQCGEDEPYNLVDLERAIAEFEANLAKELADKAAQEIMAEIKADFTYSEKIDFCENIEPTLEESYRNVCLWID